MAIQRLNLTQIATAILEAMGYANSTLAPWKTDANLYLRINEYGQRLAMRLNTVARELGIPAPVRFDMWRRVAVSAVATTTDCQVYVGLPSVDLPPDYDHWISFYNVTDGKPIYPIQNTRRWEIDDLVLSPPGMPRYIDIGGYISDGTTWRRRATLYPAPITGQLPNISLEYWRLPAAMPGTIPATEFPDIDPKYESLFIYGTITDLTRSTGQEFDRYAALEKELLVEMISTCRSM